MPRPRKATTAPIVPEPSKRARALTLLRRDDGASLTELIAATGWLPHSTRTALSGLRKQGHVLTKTKASARPGIASLRPPDGPA